jgi:hypothetical protein
MHANPLGLHSSDPPQHTCDDGSQHEPPLQQMKFGGQHWLGVYWHGTIPGLQPPTVQCPLTQVSFDAQQTPLQQMGLVRPQDPLPQGAPYAHLPVVQMAPGGQH